jgi:hypothetical protein
LVNIQIPITRIVEISNPIEILILFDLVIFIG